MCDLENGTIRTSLSDGTIESILVKEFKGVVTIRSGRFLDYIVPLDAPLTLEQVARVPVFNVYYSNGGGLRLLRKERRKDLEGAEYEAAALVYKFFGDPWTVDGDVQIASFPDGKYVYYSEGTYCQPSARSGRLMTPPQYSALEDFLTRFTERVREEETLVTPLLTL